LLIENDYLLMAHSCRLRRLVLHLPGNDAEARVAVFRE
jgi:hypothetical protein